MATGTVKWFDQEKRFGFITPDEPGEDLFVQQAGIADGVRALTEGSNVEFDAEGHTKAVNVRVV
jgi:cold shock protein